jgi:hypothetical protein
MGNKWTGIIDQLLEEIAKDIKVRNSSQAERNIRMLNEFVRTMVEAKDLAL